MDLVSRIETLEAHVNKREIKASRQIQTIKRLTRIVRKIAKGKNMSEFDFDSLLDEIDETEPTKVETKEPEAEAETPQQSDVMTSMTDEEVTHNPVDVEPTPEPTPETPVSQDISEKAQEVIDVLESEIDSLNDTIKGLKQTQSDAVIDQVELPDMEYQNEVKQFLKEFNSLEFEKREIQEKTKMLKDEYKEIGVDVTSAIKAQREIMKELKETAEEAQIIEAYKGLVKNDDALMNDVNILTA